MKYPGIFALKNIHQQILVQLKQGTDNNFQIAAAMGLGIVMGIVPVWGFQMLLGIAVAHVLRLNKALVVLFSNISIPPMIPFILFTSMQTGSLILTGEWLLVVPEKLTIQICLQSLWCYIVGSMIFAICAGFLTLAMAWGLLCIFRKA